MGKKVSGKGKTVQKCPSCGTPRNGQSRYCSKCGMDLENTVTQQPCSAVAKQKSTFWRSPLAIIAMVVAVLLIASIIIAIVVPVSIFSDDSFSMEKYNTINIGDTKQQVTETLGVPYIKDINKYEYFTRNYRTLNNLYNTYGKLLQSVTFNNKNLYDIAMEELEKQTFQYISVTFDTDGLVDGVYYNTYCSIKTYDMFKRYSSYSINDQTFIYYERYDVLYEVEYDGAYYKGVAVRDFCPTPEDNVLTWQGLWNTKFVKEIDLTYNENIVAYGSCGDNADYALSKDNVLSILGRGEVTQNITLPTGYQVNELYIGKEITSFSGLYVPFEVEKIDVASGNQYFAVVDGCLVDKETKTKLVRATKNCIIPDGTVQVGDYAFYGYNLTSVTIPDSVSVLDSNAFYGCELIQASIPACVADSLPKESLQMLTITSGTALADNAFANCTTLVDVKLADSLTEIGQSAFSGCTSLQNITLPYNLTQIDDRAFYGCGLLSNIQLPAMLERIGESAFYECKSLQSITLPSNLAHVGSNAFAYCMALTDVKEYCTRCLYLDDVFYKCPIVTAVATSKALYKMPKDSIKQITVLGESVSPYLFDNCTSLISVTLSDSVKSIGEKAFYGCTALKNFTMSTNVEIINRYILTNTAFYNNADNWDNGVLYVSNCLIDVNETAPSKCIVKDGTATIADSAFEDCTQITDITIPSSVNNIGYYAFRKCNFVHATIPSTFIIDITGVKSLQTLVINGGTKIYNYAFSEFQQLTSVEIQEGIESIGDYAFYGCNNLSELLLPQSINKIGADVFNLYSTTKIYYKGTAQQFDDIAIYSNSNVNLDNVYYYSVDKPLEEGNYWYYKEGVVTIW